MAQYPTVWQKKTMWAALTALFVGFLIIAVASAIWLVANVISFLQPILIPVAIAGILAYLLDPLVTRMCRSGMGRTKAVALLFTIAFLAIAALVTWLVPMISMQSANFANQLPNYTERARDRMVEVIYRYDRAFGIPGAMTRGKAEPVSLTKRFWAWFFGPSPGPHGSPSASAEATPPPEPILSAAPADQPTQADRERIKQWVEKQAPNLESQLPTFVARCWDILKKSIGGFLGVTGFLLSLVMVPIYLFFFLKERPRIEERWKDYLPLRDSPLKEEVAEVLSQINSYIIAYFRGQLLVCLVDGMLIGSILTLFGLNFAPLIGVMVVILTMIPYIGIVVCWVPAVLIAAAQYGDWTHPLWVTIIFVVVQNLEGMFYAPRIVGNSVGLHPVTVIVSIFVWGLLIGGLLGPILAVPLTATLKVLLARYVWERRLRAEVLEPVEDTPVVGEAKAAKALG
jgi:predicted PurR-regulated permease PerM